MADRSEKKKKEPEGSRWGWRTRRKYQYVPPDQLETEDESPRVSTSVSATTSTKDTSRSSLASDTTSVSSKSITITTAIPPDEIKKGTQAPQAPQTKPPQAPQTPQTRPPQVPILAKTVQPTAGLIPSFLKPWRKGSIEAEPPPIQLKEKEILPTNEEEIKVMPTPQLAPPIPTISPPKIEEAKLPPPPKKIQEVTLPPKIQEKLPPPKIPEAKLTPPPPKMEENLPPPKIQEVKVPPPLKLPVKVEDEPPKKITPSPAPPVVEVPAPPALQTGHVPVSTSEGLPSTLEPEKPGKRISKKPRPSRLLAYDYDLEDSELGAVSSGSEGDHHDHDTFRLNVLDPKYRIPLAPDDELLYTLTEKEELVYQRSLNEMRWEAEEMFEDEDETTDMTDTEDEAAASLLWERIAARSGRPTLPIISVNEKRISLSHLDPQPESTTGPSGNLSSYHAVFGRKNDDSSDSDEETIFHIIDEAERRNKERVDEETKRSQIRAKLWRRRLIVVILFNFVVRFRRKVATFNELVVPMIITSVLLIGMVLNTDEDAQTLAVDNFEETAGNARANPFERVGTEFMFTAFCSNDEYCEQKSERYFLLVYSPKNQFTTDLIRRVVKLLGFKYDPRQEQDLDEDIYAFENTDHELSRMIGVKNSSEVERLCRKQWTSVNQQITQKREYYYEHNRNEARDTGKLLRYPVGIVFSFDDGLVSIELMRNIANGTDLPSQLTYTIRTFYSEISNTVEGFPFIERTTDAKKFPATPYLYTGVAGIQIAIDLAFAQKITEQTVKQGNTRMKIGQKNPIYVQRESFLNGFQTEPCLKQFEFPTYKGTTLKIRAWVIIVMTIIASYVVCDITVAQDIVHEQQRGSIELLKIHGMTTSMRWIANTIITAILRGVSSLAPALIIHYKFTFVNVAKLSSDPIFLWIFLVMHGTTTTCFNYFLTTGMGIRKTELAGTVVVCVGILSFLGPLHLFVEGYLNRYTNVLLCYIFPQWNLANGLYYYLRYEIYEEGLDWYDFPAMVDTDVHVILAMPAAMSTFVQSAFIYLGLTIYMDHILQREFSPKESWLFFLKSFLRKSPAETKSTRPIPKSQKPSVFEVGPFDGTHGPRFRNVTVSDGSKGTVLDNISLDIYEGEVTCIVGQVGSGKSAFLNVIAGVAVPSAGFVDVKGLKVHEYHDITNRYVSLCPQKQLLMETLSVEDHIRLCCMLHGASYAKAKIQATFLLKMFGLMAMRRHNYKGLTSGETKKVLVAMALSKSPNILLLDNPIDQLDPESALQFWKLLQELKPQRSIIVTCTKLEDAFLYGDRIAVLSKGKLICYGRPLFIKLNYSMGNVMTLRKADGKKPPNAEKIQDIMKKELSGARVTLLDTKGISLQSDCIQFIMPFGKFYNGVIEKLETQMVALRISKITVTQPSLWALFHKIAHHAGIERVLAIDEARFLKGIEADEFTGFEAAGQPPIPTRKEQLSSSIFHIGGILVLKKIWYYRQKYTIPLQAYLAQIFLILQLSFFARLFLPDEPEGLSKVISSRMYENNQILVRSADNEHTREGWEEAFKYVLAKEDKEADVKILGYEDDIQSVLETGRTHSLTHYKKQTIVAFGRDESGHVGYYSSNSLHSGPIASHILMQAFLYMISPNRETPYSTVMVSHPLIRYQGFPASSTQSNSATMLGVLLSIVLALFSVPAIRMIMVEKTSGFKTLQRMAGVSSTLYWFSHGIADFMLYLFLISIFFPLMGTFDYFGYQQCTERGGRPIIGLWLCWTAIPYTYFVPICHIIPMRMTGYGNYLLFHFLLGILPKIITYQFLRLKLSSIYIFLRYAFYVFPPYSITSACIHFFHIVKNERWCRGADVHTCALYENMTKILQEDGEDDYYYTTDSDNPDEPDAAEFQEHDRRLQLFKKIGVSSSQLHYVEEQIAFNDTFRTCCKKYCELAGTCHNSPTYFPPHTEDGHIPGLKHDLVALVVNGFVFWILVILIENKIIQDVYKFIATKLCGDLEKTVAQRDVKTMDEPADVKEEHLKVDYMVEIEGDVDTEVYLVQDVTKFFAYNKGLDHVYFTIPCNTTTGILGIPKAGKTTLLSVLTGLISPSAGYIYKDNDLLDRKSKYNLLLRVGYCPQDNPLLPYLTGSQMMTIMGRLRGLTNSECEQHVHWWFKIFGLENVAHKKVSTYRFGQERILSCALTLIGDTSMIIFDEPTAYMDNMEKYIFWNTISKLPALGRTVVFTSNNAEEVQNYSSKTLLVDSGAVVAVGQLTQIFKSTNQGLFLAIRYGVKAYRKYTDFQKKVKVDKLKDHVIKFLRYTNLSSELNHNHQYCPCALLDDQENLLIYHLKDTNLTLSRIYTVMEAAKVRFILLLEQFQVYEPSLDDIILQFHNARNKKQEKQPLAEQGP